MTFTVEILSFAELLASNSRDPGSPLCHVNSNGRMILQTAPDRFGRAKLLISLKGLAWP